MISGNKFVSQRPKVAFQLNIHKNVTINLNSPRKTELGNLSENVQYFPNFLQEEIIRSDGVFVRAAWQVTLSHCWGHIPH